MIGIFAGHSRFVISHYLEDIPIAGFYGLYKHDWPGPGLLPIIVPNRNISDIFKYYRAIGAFPLMGRLLVLIDEKAGHRRFGLGRRLGKRPAQPYGVSLYAVVQITDPRRIIATGRLRRAFLAASPDYAACRQADCNRECSSCGGYLR